MSAPSQCAARAQGQPRWRRPLQSACARRRPQRSARCRQRRPSAAAPPCGPAARGGARAWRTARRPRRESAERSRRTPRRLHAGATACPPAPPCLRSTTRPGRCAPRAAARRRPSCRAPHSPHPRAAAASPPPPETARRQFSGFEGLQAPHLLLGEHARLAPVQLCIVCTKDHFNGRVRHLHCPAVLVRRRKASRDDRRAGCASSPRGGDVCEPVERERRACVGGDEFEACSRWRPLG